MGAATLMFDSVLIANRGEIAVRVIRTLGRLGIRSIAVYSDADANAPHVRLADVALRLGPGPAAESYLSVERVLAAAVASGAEAIHPGYGFLSENAGFARACAQAGVVFVGPPPEAIELLGDKVAAKAAAEAAGIPVLPGLQRRGLADADIVAFAAADAGRLPLMIKAAAGGGGRGMRVVRDAADLPAAIAAARREARAGFGDDALFVERYVERARHVEVQLLADAHGAAVHLGERECSLQRRHQKLVEECPSPAVSASLRAELGAAAVDLALAAGYVGAGTAEFLLSADDPGEWFFLEVNARLQVEHPVTELVTGVDLVEQQLLVAAGEPLAIAQDDVRLHGCAIEARVCGEDPGNDFLPVTGAVAAYREPEGSGVRVDSGVREGSTVTAHYDSLLAKVICGGGDREEALDRLTRALADLRILGVTTNAGFLARLVDLPEVRAGALTTTLVEDGQAATRPGEAEGREAAIAATAVELLELHGRPSGDPWDTLVGFRLDRDPEQTWEWVRRGEADAVAVTVRGRLGAAEPLAVTVQVDRAAAEPVAATAPRAPDADAEHALTVEALRPGSAAVTLDGRTRRWDHALTDGERWVSAGADAFAFALVEPVVADAAGAAEGSLEAPMPGTVLRVEVAVGDSVAEGDLLLVLESMKMELTLTAPAAATVGALHVHPGDGVKQGQPLVELEAPA